MFIHFIAGYLVQNSKILRLHSRVSDGTYETLISPTDAFKKANIY